MINESHANFNFLIPKWIIDISTYFWCSIYISIYIYVKYHTVYLNIISGQPIGWFVFYQNSRHILLDDLYGHLAFHTQKICPSRIYSYVGKIWK
jgi:hypothetical protein